MIDVRWVAEGGTGRKAGGMTFVLEVYSHRNIWNISLSGVLQVKRETLTHDDHQVQRSDIQILGVIPHTNVLDVKVMSSIRSN